MLKLIDNFTPTILNVKLSIFVSNCKSRVENVKKNTKNRTPQKTETKTNPLRVSTSCIKITPNVIYLLAPIFNHSLNSHEITMKTFITFHVQLIPGSDTFRYSKHYNCWYEKDGSSPLIPYGTNLYGSTVYKRWYIRITI